MTKPVLMCVDDEEIILLSLKDQLREHFGDELHFEMVDSGDDALGLFEELLVRGIEVPVIVCDQIMPGMKGNELLRRVHQISPKTFSVLLTGHADAGAVGDAVNHANLFRYIAKPWEETDLVLTIKEAVRSFFQDKQLEAQNLALLAMNENLEQKVVERTAEILLQKEEIQRQMQDIERQREELQLRNDFIRDVFGRYVSDEVMNTVLQDPEGLQMGGAKRDITVLLSDLRGFTALTDRLPADTIMRLLNRYFERMTEIISEYGGIVIEFLGDGVLALFGAPKQLDDHADKAVACALSMQLAMEELNSIHAAEVLPMIEMGIGLTSGEVVAGNIGSERRAKYGIVGTPVNMVARIEALSTGQQVLISSDTLARCKAKVHVEHEFEVSVKGIKAPLKIYDVTGIELPKTVVYRPAKLDLRPLQHEVLIELSELDGKSLSSSQFRGEVLALSHRAARIRLDKPLPPHADVRISVVTVAGVRTEIEIYAKVISDTPDGIVLRFTSVFFADTERKLAEILGTPFPLPGV